jgi:hypothetical protein
MTLLRRLALSLCAALLFTLSTFGAAPTHAAVPVAYEGPSWMPRLAMVGDSMTWTSVDTFRPVFQSEWWRSAIFSFPGVRTETMRDQIRGMAADRPDAFVVQLGALDTLDLITGARSWAWQQQQIAGVISDVQARGVPCMVWVGPNENFDGGQIDFWTEQINAEIRYQLQLRGAGSYADWSAVSEGHPEYFLPDGSHLTPVGTPVYANMIANELRDCARNPKGSLDAVQAGVGVRVAGWAFDPDTSAVNDVHVYVDGAFRGSYAANTSRPDVAAAFPGVTANHGFDINLLVGAGAHDVCVYAINQGPYGFTNPTLGCRRVVVNGTPVGFVDSATRAGSSVTVQGWTIDPDTNASIAVHLYVDGAFMGQSTAGGARGDLAAAFPAYGANHGYSMGVTGLASGSHQFCVYAINAPATSGTNPLLGCRSVSVP